MYVCNFSNREVEVEWLGLRLFLINEFEMSMIYMRFCFRRKKKGERDKYINVELNI